MILRLKTFFLFLIVFQATSHSESIQVLVNFQEALAERDASASVQFQKEYEKCIELSQKYLKEKLQSCGYEIKTSQSFYDSNDPLQAKELSIKAQAEKNWLIVGPRRSNHYVLSTLGAADTPSISTMASSKEVMALSGMHLTLGVDNATIAAVLVDIAKEKAKRKKITYATIVNEDCIFCTDLSKEFDLHAQGFVKLKEVKVVGDTPDILKIRKELGAIKPDFVLVPNYSESSMHIMAGLKTLMPKTVYLGGDGWGTQTFGFVKSSVNLQGVIGYSAQGLVPVEDGLKTFSLGQILLKDFTEKKEFIEVPAGISILRIMSGLSDVLCATKPKTAEDFKAVFLKEGKAYFAQPWGLGVYKLNGSNFSFYKVIKK